MAQRHWQSVESAAFHSSWFKIPSGGLRLIRVRSCWRAGSGLPNKGHGGVFVGRAGLAAFSAAARAFEGRDVAEIGGSQANPESIISFSAAAGDGLQSTRSGLPRRKATRARDLLT